MKKEKVFNKELIGKKFGRLTVLEPDCYRSNNYYWKCQCECGRIISTAESNLKGGRSTMCTECAKKVRAERRALKLVPIGSKWGRLTVLEKVPSPSPNRTNAYYRCKCDCGNETIVLGKFLRNGHTKSCGCYRKEVLTDTSMIGKKFGMLTVLGIDHITKSRGTTGCRKFVRCKCDCGNETIVRYDLLANRQPGKAIISCGCLAESYGEKKVREYLEEHAITFKPQQTFKDLWVTNEHSPLKYDFAVKSRNGRQIYFLIEYDGIQHFEEVDFFKMSLKEVQERDEKKNEYAKTNNIPLLRIPYTELNNIEKILEDYIKTNFNFLIKSKDAQ